jgi:hypothetical protein
MRARSVWLAGITAVGVLLGGCAGEEAPASLPEVTSSATSSAEVPPEVVEDSTPSEPVGDLLAFMDEYYETANAAFRDPAALREWERLFADSCELCVAGYRIAETVHQAEQTYEGGDYVDWTIVVDEESHDSASVRSLVGVEAARIIDTNGQVVSQFDELRDFTEVYQLQRQPSGHWLIVAGRDQ